MRNNYDIAALNARALFLQWDQPRMIERCGLKADAETMSIRFLGSEYTIERGTGIVRRTAGDEAGFAEVMVIYDYLCRAEPMPPENGNRKAAHALSYAGTTSPSEGALSARAAAYLQTRLDVLDEALSLLKCDDFPVGDHAVVFPVFDRMHAVFQFWEGDDEFPPRIRYLWDETAPTRLKFETLWYVMGEFERQLKDAILALKK